MGGGGSLGVADRGQIDRRGPREQQADVPVDGGPRVRGEGDPELGQPAGQRQVVRVRQGRGVPDIRRERLALGADGTPPLVCVPSGRGAAPDVGLVSHLSDRFGLPRSIRLRGRVSPYPSWTAVPWRAPVRKPDGTRRPVGPSTRLSTNARRDGGFVDNSAGRMLSDWERSATSGGDWGAADRRPSSSTCRSMWAPAPRLPGRTRPARPRRPTDR